MIVLCIAMNASSFAATQTSKLKAVQAYTIIRHCLTNHRSLLMHDLKRQYFAVSTGWVAGATLEPLAANGVAARAEAEGEPPVSTSFGPPPR
jgi:hypothetical protein